MGYTTFYYMRIHGGPVADRRKAYGAVIDSLGGKGPETTKDKPTMDRHHIKERKKILALAGRFDKLEERRHGFRRKAEATVMELMGGRNVVTVTGIIHPKHVNGIMYDLKTVERVSGGECPPSLIVRAEIIDNPRNRNLVRITGQKPGDEDVFNFDLNNLTEEEMLDIAKAVLAGNLKERNEGKEETGR